MSCAAAVACSVLLVLAGAGGAQAGTVSRVGATITYQAAPGDRDGPHVLRTESTYEFRPIGGPFVPVSAGTGCAALPEGPGGSPPAGASCPLAGAALVQLDLLDQDDTALMWHSMVAVEIAGGLGDDTLDGGAGDDELAGGPGKDRINGLDGTDVIVAGPGDDDMTAGGGTGDVVHAGDGDDRIQGLSAEQDTSGGAGADVLVVGGADVTVSLDDSANDGRGSATGANVRSDVENVLTFEGADALTGSSAVNRLESSGGADRLAGGRGADVLLSGSGDDLVDARDGEADSVDCGPGQDMVDADRGDAAAGCELVRFDEDRDGVTHDLDCDDGNAGVRPGAVDILDNDIDEDCAGGPAIDLDRDRDGFLRPGDCDDGDPAINLGALEVPGDSVDEDCVAGPQPFPRIASGIQNNWSARRRRTRVVKLVVRDAPVGALVRLRCRGRGCPKRRIRRVRATGGKEIRLTRHLRGRRLRPGAVIEIRITASGWIGKVVRYRIRAGRLPKPTILCLEPGGRRPGACAPEQ